MSKRRPRSREYAVAFLVALLLHALMLLLFFSGALDHLRPPPPEPDGAATLTMVDLAPEPEQEEQAEPPLQPDQLDATGRPIVNTVNMPSAEAQKEARFESEKNTRLSSPDAGDSPNLLPAVNGKDERADSLVRVDKTHMAKFESESPAPGQLGPASQTVPNQGNPKETPQNSESTQDAKGTEGKQEKQNSTQKNPVLKPKAETAQEQQAEKRDSREQKLVKAQPKNEAREEIKAAEEGTDEAKPEPVNKDKAPAPPQPAIKTERRDKTAQEGLQLAELSPDAVLPAAAQAEDPSSKPAAQKKVDPTEAKDPQDTPRPPPADVTPPAQSTAPAPKSAVSSAPSGREVSTIQSSVAYVRGGQVRTPGAASLDTKETTLGKYRGGLYKAVAAQWTYMVDKNVAAISIGTVKLRYTIRADGTLTNVKVIQNTSGSSLTESIATSALQLTSPFPPLPPEIRAQVGAELSMEFEFTIY